MDDYQEISIWKTILKIVLWLLIWAAVLFGLLWFFRLRKIARPVEPTPAVTPTIYSTPSYLSFTEPWFQHEEGVIGRSYFYKPPDDNSYLPTIGREFDAVILTGNDESQRNVILNSGMQNKILRYVLFNEINPANSCNETPWQNQAAFMAGDFCSIESDHRDWMAVSASGRIEGENTGSYLMDPSSEGWRNFFYTRVSQYQTQYKWDGFFFDNVEAGKSKVIREVASSGLRDYPDLNDYVDQIADFLREVTGKLRSDFPGQPIVANIIEVEYDDPTTIANYYRLLEYLNGAMIEDFATGWRNTYKTRQEWETQMDMVEHTQELGRNMILVVQSDGISLNYDRLTFGLASYFLTDRGLSSVRYSSSDQGIDFYEFYKLNLGSPLGYRYQVGTTWVRDFEYGQVSVDPDTHKAEINLYNTGEVTDISSATE